MPSPEPSDVRRVYAWQAPRYDRRWKGYLEASLSPTLGALVLPPSARALDVGCGTGVLLERIRERGVEGWGVDLSPEMLGVAAERLGGGARLVRADAGALPFPDACFDAVASSSALHHWPDPTRTVAEMLRVLRPGGQMVLTDWDAAHLATRLRSAVLRWFDPSHHRSYTEREARGMMERVGLTGVRGHRHRHGLGWGFFTVQGHRPRA